MANKPRPTAARDASPQSATNHEIVEKLRRLGAPRRRVDPRRVKLMLAETGDRPFSGPQWIFELKYDGFRLLVAREGGAPRLLYRRGSEVTATFPEIARAAAALPFDHVVLDGEVVVLDEAGHPSFQRLQKRVQLLRSADIERATIDLPATAFLFDIFGFGDFDLRPLPLIQRKDILRLVVPRTGPLCFTDHIEERGEELYREIGRLGLEGLVAKRRDSPYRERRSADWLKLRLDRTADFAVVGFTEPKGARAGLGSLHLALFSDDGRLRYAGRAGSGLGDRQLAEVRARLEARRRSDPPCEGALPRGKGHVWVEPELVCEVRYKEWTEDGLLRHPVFLRFRDDKGIEECRDDLMRERLPPPPSGPVAAPPAAERNGSERTIAFSNLDKVFWPKERYT
ncbi:MAG: non-homologous end-joining DNA ligase, partial [Candidatus Binatia bacterium]